MYHNIEAIKEQREYFLKNYLNEITNFLKINYEDLSNGLLCTMFNGIVEIELNDNSKFRFDSSFYVQKDDIIAIFTEHYGYWEFENFEIKSISYKEEDKIVFNLHEDNYKQLKLF